VGRVQLARADCCESASLFPKRRSCTHTVSRRLNRAGTNGSAARPYRRLYASPLFLNVSRFKILCPANVSNPIASPPAIPWKAFYAGHKKVDRHSCLFPSRSVRRLCATANTKSAPIQRGAPFAPLRKSFLFRSHVRHILRESSPSGLCGERPGVLK